VEALYLWPLLQDGLIKGIIIIIITTQDSSEVFFIADSG